MCNTGADAAVTSDYSDYDQRGFKFKAEIDSNCVKPHNTAYVRLRTIHLQGTFIY